MEVGDKIAWMTVSGRASGIIESVDGNNRLVRLANGKSVIVNRKSIISNGEEKNN